MSLGSMELWILLGLVVLLFGGTQIPKIARNLGKAKREFQEGMKENADPEEEKQDKGKDS